MESAAKGKKSLKLVAGSAPPQTKPEAADARDREAVADRPVSPTDRAAAGKALRESVPRALHAKWKKPEHRPDPIDTLIASDVDRLPDLVPIRYGRMMQSPFAFYRGTAGVMAGDLATTPATGIRVQACGDCHLMNFGGFATPERNILFDINDFDETLPAPWEWDVKRLAASFVLAARSNGFSDNNARDAAVTCACNYRKRLAAYAEMHPIDVWYARVTADDVIGLSSGRTGAHPEAGREACAAGRVRGRLSQTGRHGRWQA
jgi:hypothetical protein